MSGSINSPYTIMNSQIIDNTTGAITPAMVRNIVESAAGVSASAKTASYSVAITDRGTVINVNSSSATNVTVNSSTLSAGHQFAVRQIGTGQVTIVAGSGMTRQSSSGTYTTRAQYSLVIITVHTDGTTLLLDGDLT